MTALIILAAGASSRLGFPKQTLLYKGKTLLELAIEAGVRSRCDEVMVVLGANAETIESGIKHYDIKIIHNTDWASGMASSIVSAMKQVQANPQIRSVVVMLCDQPFVTRNVLDSLLFKQQQTSKHIIACTYKDTVGVPAMFTHHLFPQLLLLQGNEGAKKLVTDRPDEPATIAFEKGGIDIDTVADYEALIRNA
jgi:molybdenum cofactor cytidylyltransferase